MSVIATVASLLQSRYPHHFIVRSSGCLHAVTLALWTRRGQFPVPEKYDPGSYFLADDPHALGLPLPSPAGFHGALAVGLCRRAVEAGRARFAPHLLYPCFLDDRDPAEQHLGIDCGLAFMEVCDEVRVYTADGPSSRMRREFDQASRLGKPVVEIEEA